MQRLFHFLFFFSLFVSAFSAKSQCTFFVNAEANPLKVCAPGGTVTLTGTTDAVNIFEQRWTPPVGLANPGNAITTANITSTSLYTYTVKALTDNDVIINGDFESGNSGFGSSYGYYPPVPASTPLLFGGSYTILQSPNQVSGTFPPCDDHTFMNGTGHMMFVNSINTTGQDIWCQTVSVNPTSDYIFSMWMGGLGLLGPDLQVTVNGVPLGNAVGGAGICSWSNFTDTWTNPGTTSAEICISVNSANFIGPIFSLDDISFLEICQAQDDVLVEVIEVESIILPPDKVDCRNTEVILDGTLSSSGADINYLWSTPDGDIIGSDNQNTTVAGAEGEYFLTVTYDDGNVICTDISSVFVEENIMYPTAAASDPDFISCKNPVIQLDGSGSTQGANISYLWTTDDGFILSGSTGLMPSVDITGTYQIAVTNDVNGCKDSITVYVDGNTDKPTARITAPDSLSCGTASVLLDGSGSDQGSDIIYRWNTDDGSFVGSTDSIVAEADSTGEYFLIVTDTLNGCFDTADIVVYGDTTNSLISIAPVDSLTCINRFVNIDASASTLSANSIFSWTTVGGNFLSGDTTLTPVVDSSGEYRLQIIDTLNFCTDTLKIAIKSNTQKPSVNGGLPQTFSCITDSVMLNASALVPDSNFQYRWEAISGTVLSGDSSLSPYVGSAGTYLIFTLDTLNGCESADTAYVLPDTDLPVVQINLPDTLTCDATEISLDASGSDTGSNFNFSWIAQSGSFFNPPVNYQPSVNAPGTYELSILNTLNGCENKISVQVFENIATPVVNIDVPDTLSCNLSPMSLDATNSSLGIDYSYNWTTLSGNILSGDNTLTPEINQPGTYYFSIFNTKNGCETLDSISVSVSSGLTGISIQLTDSDTLNCNQPTITASTLSGNFSYNWVNATNSSGGAWTENVLIENPGIVSVEITDNDSGCKGQNSIEIFSDFEEPDADAGNVQELSCSVDSVMITGSGSLGNIFQYEWNTSNGNILSGQNSLTPTINSPGWYFLTTQNSQNGCTKTDSVEITASREIPSGTIQPAFIYTCVTQSGQLDASGSDLGANFQYQWSSPDGNLTSNVNSLTPTVNRPGTYFLEILNTDNDCDITVSVQVDADTITPDINAGKDTLINCYHPRIFLSGSVNSNRTNFRYEWQTIDGNIVQNGTSDKPGINAPGVYDFTVTDLQNGCKNTASVSVSSDFSKPNPTPILPDTLTCIDSIIDVTVSLPTPDNDYLFSWSTMNGRIIDNIDSSTVRADIGGSFRSEITLLSTGCKDTVDILVAESKELPTISINTLSSITCKDSIVQISGTGTDSGNGITYQWTTENGTFISPRDELNAIVSNSGKYLLTVRNTGTGCKNTDSVQVVTDTLPPVLSLPAPDTLTCDELEITLLSDVSGTANPIFSWSTVNGNIISPLNQEEITVIEPGEYYLSTENPDNGCETQASVVVFQNITPPNIEFELPEFLTCSRTSVQLDAANSSSGGQFSYEWSTNSGHILTGGNGLTPVVDSSGIYHLSIRNIFTGCQSSDSIEVFRVENTLDSLITSGIHPTCDNPLGSVQAEEVLGGFPPYEFSLDGSAFSDSVLFENLQQGDYLLTVRDSNGCTLNSSVQLLMPAPILISNLPDLDLLFGVNHQIEAIVNKDSSELTVIQWSPEDGLSCTNCLNPILIPSMSQTYMLQITDKDGCKAQASFNVEVETEIDVFFPSGFSPNNDNINDFFRGYAAPGVISKFNTLQIYDRWGNKLFEVNNGTPSDPNFGWDGAYNGKQMDTGVYIFFAEIELSNGETKIFKGDVTLRGREK